MKKYASYFYDNKFDYIINVDSKRTVDDPLITYYFNRMDLKHNKNFVKIRPELKPEFSLNHNNRNSLIIVNTYHINSYYTSYLKDIESKGILMFKDDLYEVFIW
jgi:hypothetical protein